MAYDRKEAAKKAVAGLVKSAGRGPTKPAPAPSDDEGDGMALESAMKSLAAALKSGDWSAAAAAFRDAKDC